MADLADSLAGQVCIAVKVILVEGVLNANDGVLLAVVAVLLLQLLPGLDLLWVWVLGLEVQVVLVVLKELAGCDIHADLHLAHISGLLHVNKMLRSQQNQVGPARCMCARKYLFECEYVSMYVYVCMYCMIWGSTEGQRTESIQMSVSQTSILTGKQFLIVSPHALRSLHM